MAQLTDDCFAFSGPLLPVEEVERIIRERVTPVAEMETVALNAAIGRVIARDIIAPIDLPPFDNSAVDGYAVRHADLDAKSETRLAVVERVTAGRAAAHALAAQAAVRIFTGAPMPGGADTVFMQEDVRVDGESVLVPPFNAGPVKETTGAGDAFNGGFAAALSKGMSPLEAVRFGSAVAGISVTRAGTAPSMPALHEVEALLKQG